MRNYSSDFSDARAQQWPNFQLITAQIIQEWTK